MNTLKMLLLMSLVSCAASSYVLKQKDLLPYKESSQISKLNQESKSITINSIEDKRKKTDFGFAYTGVEYKKSPVYFDVPLSKLVKEHLVSSFQMRNIEIVANGEIKLDVIVKELWVNEVIEKMKPERAYCKLNFEFAISGDSAKWNGSYWTEFTSAGDMSDGTERLAPTLASCMNELVEKMMTDEKFVQMLKKEENE